METCSSVTFDFGGNGEGLDFAALLSTGGLNLPALDSETSKGSGIPQPIASTDDFFSSFQGSDAISGLSSTGMNSTMNQLEEDPFASSNLFDASTLDFLRSLDTTTFGNLVTSQSKSPAATIGDLEQLLRSAPSPSTTNSCPPLSSTFFDTTPNDIVVNGAPTPDDARSASRSSQFSTSDSPTNDVPMHSSNCRDVSFSNATSDSSPLSVTTSASGKKRGARKSPSEPTNPSKVRRDWRGESARFQEKCRMLEGENKRLREELEFASRSTQVGEARKMEKELRDWKQLAFSARKELGKKLEQYKNRIKLLEAKDEGWNEERRGLRTENTELKSKVTCLTNLNRYLQRFLDESVSSIASSSSSTEPSPFFRSNDL